jgi:hypothetical protein
VTLKGLFLATALTCSFGTGALADPLLPFNPGDFSVIIGPGFFTVVDNSSDWSVSRFLVENPGAVATSPNTTQPGWTPSTISGSPGWPFKDSNDANAIFIDSGLQFWNQTGNSSLNVQPGTSSSNFTFVGPVGDRFEIFATDRFGELETVFGMTAAVPEPSTWAMMILGFFGIGFMAYRRKQSGSALSVA